MRRLLLGLFGLLAVVGLLCPAGSMNGQEKAQEGGKEKGNGGDWVQLFNGKDLTGWKVHPDEPGNWKVEDGMIVGRGKDRSHLFSEKGDYTNFIYRVEAKISDKGNSGQYFRAKYMAGYPKGYEAQINSTHPDPQKTGSLYGLAKVTKQLVKPDTWFTQEVIAMGNHIIIKVNGKKVVDYLDSKGTYSNGHFAFQQHPPGPDGTASTVYIRKVEIMSQQRPKKKE